MKFVLPAVLLWLVLVTGAAGVSLEAENNPVVKEAFRLKVWNCADGTIEVSADRGKSWRRIGSVVYPTEQTNADSFAAAAWVADGKVAATAVNAIHLKVSTEADGRAVIFSLLPAELLVKPDNYRSYFNATSSIYTDIPGGTTIFGGGYAPLVGNTVLLSRAGYQPVPWPTGYRPLLNDRIYILVDKPVEYPKEIVLENKVDGAVTLTYFDGLARLVGRVVKPVSGVGRFEGTKYAAPGRIRANHPGVIDVSTSRLGQIGGFQIVPAKHGENIKYAMTSPQWLVIGPLDPSNEAFEGRAPFFKYFIRPNYAVTDLAGEDWPEKLLARFLVEVRRTDSAKWEPVPVVEFSDYFLTGNVIARANSALRDVTAVRIVFPIE
ncbi:MAG: hypothetical protein MUC35_03700 [Candidatus Margulisbacteria bacterium]|jgi:hypothetical protein|nr:hypothetical protein [Candidatus Margulisiibacteriota bacterium]